MRAEIRRRHLRFDHVVAHRCVVGRNIESGDEPGFRHPPMPALHPAPKARNGPLGTYLSEHLKGGAEKAAYFSYPRLLILSIFAALAPLWR